MPSIGARFYTQLDSAYLWGDMVEGELEKVINQSESSISNCQLLIGLLGSWEWTSVSVVVQVGLG